MNPRELVEGAGFYAASLLDLAVDLPTALACGRIVHERAFNPLVTLKALTYFGDLPDVPAPVRQRLAAAVAAVDPAQLPALAADTPHKSDRAAPE